MDALPTPTLRVPLQTGSHTSPDEGLCVMECVAFVMGEDHTDTPACACPLVASFAMYVNDSYLDTHADALLQRVFRLAGSRKSDEVLRARAYYLFDYLLRTTIPAALRNTTLGPAPLKYADMFAALPVVETQNQFPEVLSAAAKLEEYGHRIPSLLAERIKYIAELLEEYDRPKTTARLGMSALAVIHVFKLLSVEYNVTEQHGFKPVDTDLMAVLDGLLDIGDTKAVPVTPEIAARATDLVNRHSTLSAAAVPA